MGRRTIALSARTAAQLPSIPEINAQLAAGRLQAESRLPVADLEVLHPHFDFAIVSTHEREELVQVLDALGLTKYCPHDSIVVSPKGERQNPDYWRRWREGFAAAGAPLAAVIDTGSVIEALVGDAAFDDVSKYVWPYEPEDAAPVAGATVITSLRDMDEFPTAPPPPTHSPAASAALEPRPCRTAEDVAAHAERIRQCGLSVVGEVLDASEVQMFQGLVGSLMELRELHPGQQEESVANFNMCCNLINRNPTTSLSLCPRSDLNRSCCADDARFEELVLRPAVYGIMVELLGEDVSMSTAAALEPRPGATTSDGTHVQGLHRDGWADEEVMQACQTLWMIDDASPANGGTRFVLHSPGVSRPRLTTLLLVLRFHADDAVFRVGGPAGGGAGGRLAAL